MLPHNAPKSVTSLRGATAGCGFCIVSSPDVLRPDLRECQSALWTGRRAGRRERVAAAWAVRYQSAPAVGADLPMRFDLALALVALLDELVKLLMKLQEGGLLLLFLVVHCLPPASHRPHLGNSGLGAPRLPRGKTSLWRVCPRAQRRWKRSRSPIFYNRTTAAITAMMMIITATISQVRLFCRCLAGWSCLECLLPGGALGVPSGFLLLSGFLRLCHVLPFSLCSMVPCIIGLNLAKLKNSAR